MKIVFIGAGNLATRLSLAMQRVGMQIGQVYSHTEASARQLATRLGCPWTNDLSALQEDGDLYVFSLKDAVLSDVISKVKPNNGMWVHTAGSMPMSVFEGYAQRFGVLYPLQTFSKGRNVNFDVIPIFLEANTDKNADYLKNIASALSENVRFMSSKNAGVCIWRLSLPVILPIIFIHYLISYWKTNPFRQMSFCRLSMRQYRKYIPCRLLRLRPGPQSGMMKM